LAFFGGNAGMEIIEFKIVIKKLNLESPQTAFSQDKKRWRAD
jgi:hypothetical protein